jgi:hypothetical protein
LFVRIFTLVACLTAGACRQVSYPVPAQRSVPGYRIDAVLDRDTAHTWFPESSVLSGVQPDSEHFGWSWTNPRAEFLLPLDQAQDWNFTAKITTIHDVLLNTGPQTVTFLLNNHPVKTLLLDRPETVEVDVPIAAALLQNPATTHVVMTAAPCLAQTDGPPLCVVLHRIGFTRELH